MENDESYYMTMYEYLTSLKFNMNPDYEYITRLLGKLMRGAGVTVGSPFDWEPDGEFYRKIDKTELTEVFHEEIRSD